MKKIIALTLVLAMAALLLTSCATMLFGEYTGKASLFGFAGGEVTYKFSGSKVTEAAMTQARILLGER